MADKKISALTGASTPLAGTEVLPIVQSGATVKTTALSLTTGQAINPLSIVLTGVNGCLANNGATTSGKYISFYNTSGGIQLGVESSTGGTQVIGSTPYQSLVVGKASIGFSANDGAALHMTLTTSGDFLVKKTALGATVLGAEIRASGQINSASANTDFWNSYNTTAAAFRFYVTAAGTINATSTTITGISDVRLKENIRDLDDGLDIVMALKPRKFDWKANKGKGTLNDRGFIAQEFETVFPDMIEEWKDPAPEGEKPYKAVNANLIPTLVKAIQEQQAIIFSLTSRITALEAK